MSAILAFLSPKGQRVQGALRLSLRDYKLPADASRPLFDIGQAMASLDGSRIETHAVVLDRHHHRLTSSDRASHRDLACLSMASNVRKDLAHDLDEVASGAFWDHVQGLVR